MIMPMESDGEDRRACGYLLLLTAVDLRLVVASKGRPVGIKAQMD